MDHMPSTTQYLVLRLRLLISLPMALSLRRFAPRLTIRELTLKVRFLPLAQ